MTSTGAPQMVLENFGKRTVVVSGGGSAANELGPAKRHAAPADESAARKRRRLCVNFMLASVPLESGPVNTSPASSSLQLALELVEEAPVGALRDDLTGRRLDHARLVQSQRVEPDRVLGIVVAPARVLDLLHRLQRVIVTIAFVRNQPGSTLRLGRTEIRRLRDCPQRPLSSHWMLADEVLVRRGDTTEVLRPRAVKPTADDDVADLLFPQLLGNWGKAHQCVNLSLGEKLHRLRPGIDHEVDVAFRIHPHVSRHAGEKDVMWRRKTRHGDRLPLEVANSSHSLSAEELKASGVDAAEQHDRNAGINLHDERRDERHGNIDLCGREGGMDIGRFNLNILNVAKAFGLKQFFGHVLRGDTDAWDLREADGRDFRRRLLRETVRPADQTGGAGRK